jgi:hypothetical protein
MKSTSKELDMPVCAISEILGLLSTKHKNRFKDDKRFTIHRLYFYSILRDPPSLLSSGYQGLFTWDYSGRGVKLTTHLHLVPRSKNA